MEINYKSQLILICCNEISQSLSFFLTECLRSSVEFRARIVPSGFILFVLSEFKDVVVPKVSV